MNKSVERDCDPLQKTELNQVILCYLPSASLLSISSSSIFMNNQ